VALSLVLVAARSIRQDFSESDDGRYRFASKPLLPGRLPPRGLSVSTFCEPCIRAGWIASVINRAWRGACSDVPVAFDSNRNIVSD